MLERKTDFKILAEQVLVCLDAAIAGLQRLVNEKPARPLATIEHSKAFRGIPEQFQVTGDNAVILRYVGEKA